jgi:DNA invertase Pin-like site-specific DNA recombinase
MKVGYARVSTNYQKLDSQIEALKKAGCDKIFMEKMSGIKKNNRNELNNALNFVREGDIFIVTRLDRCSRSVKDLHDIIKLLDEKNVQFKATAQDIDTSTSTGRFTLGALALISEFESDLRAERQADGIASAKAKGVTFGRTSKFNEEKCIEALSMKDTGMTNIKIAEYFKVDKSTLLRHLAKYKKNILDK